MLGYELLPSSDVAPPAGAWIETQFHTTSLDDLRSRLPQARGLKQLKITQAQHKEGRASRRRVD